MVYFEQQKDEEIVEIIRKSLWTLIPHLFRAFALSIPAVFALLYFDIALLTIGALGWLIVVLAHMFYDWLLWYYNVYILTSERIIEIRQRSLFAKEVNEINLNKVQDVSYSKDGFHSSLFGYGSVQVYSSGTLSIGLNSVPSPEETQKIILELTDNK